MIRKSTNLMNFSLLDTWRSYGKKNGFGLYGCLLAILVCYSLPGLVSHSPWKTLDALYIGSVFDQYDHGFSLFPTLTGQPWLNHGPLGVWIQHLFLKLWPLWPGEPAGLIRLPNVFYLIATLLLASAIGKKEEEDNGFLALPLLILGSVGLLLPMHEASPTLLSALFWMLGYHALINSPKHPIVSGLVSGLTIAGIFMTWGLSAALIVQVAMPFLALMQPFGVTSTGNPSRNRWMYMAMTLVFALLPVVLWWLSARAYQPENLEAWWMVQEAKWYPSSYQPTKFFSILKLISWTTWPVWPLALYTLYSFIKERKNWNRTDAIPLLLFAIAIAGTFFLERPRLSISLIFCFPLAVLAVRRVTHLSYMITGLLGWFSALIFTLVIVYFWITLSAMTIGIPVKYAEHLARIFPGFAYPIDPVSFLVAGLIFMGWVVFLILRPYPSLRDLLNWCGGLTLFWALGMLLGLPLLDHVRSYEGVTVKAAHAIGGQKRQLHTPFGPCLSYQHLGATQRASFSYFTNLQLHPLANAETCGSLIIQDNPEQTFTVPGPEWQLILTLARPKDKNEIYRLYVRKNDTFMTNIE